MFLMWSTGRVKPIIQQIISFIYLFVNPPMVRFSCKDEVIFLYLKIPKNVIIIICLPVCFSYQS